MKITAIIVAILVLFAGVFVTTNKVSPVSWGWWGEVNADSGVALFGNDPVSYSDAGEPVKGSADIHYDWRGARWHFASETSRARFEQSPETYAPQFGGFCAFAVSKGFTAKASVDAWEVLDGKLYLFADNNVKQQWIDDVEKLGNAQLADPRRLLPRDPGSEKTNLTDRLTIGRMIGNITEWLTIPQLSWTRFFLRWEIQRAAPYWRNWRRVHHPSRSLCRPRRCRCPASRNIWTY